MSDKTRASACGGKHKLERDEPHRDEPDRKRCRRDVNNSENQDCPSLPSNFRNPQQDCHGHEGRDFLPVRDPGSYVGISKFEVNHLYGHFSVDAERNFKDDSSQLKFLHLPKNILKLHMDLNIGYENVIKRNRTVNEKLNAVLRWIISNKELFLLGRGESKGPKLLRSMPFDFICFRGLLTTLLCTPYEKNEDWSISATKFKGTIYLCAFPTPSRMAKEARMTDRQKLMCSWGYKFEQYLTKSHPSGQPDSPETPVNENEEFCAMFKGQLNNDVFLYGAEVDALNMMPLNKAGLASKFVELKTSRIITHEMQDINFCMYRVIKWWAQCYLADIARLFCGFRDDSGVVQYIRSFHLVDLLSMGKGLWSQSVCLDFANCFFSFVKNVVVKDDPNVVYKFSWSPRHNITYKEIDVSDDPENGVLPDWYLSQFEP